MSAISTLTRELPAGSWTTNADAIAPHLVEWRDRYRGASPVLLTPRSTGEVSRMVRLCASLGLSVVPQGGNTGLVGGQTPRGDLGEVLLSLRKMNAIRKVNPVTDSLVAEAGATLASVQRAAAEVARKFPLSLASEGSATVGGLISTNAGGVHVLRYGTTRALVFGVEAVLADGRVFGGLTSLRKDNTGYDLSNLFVGAEGTLGIVTAASLKLFAVPGHVQRAMVGVESAEAALRLLEGARATGRLALFEVMPRIGLEMVLAHIPGQRDPFGEAYPWYVLADWEADGAAEGEALAEAVLGKALEAGLARDAVVAQSDAQAAALLALREHLSEAQKYEGGSIKQDITVPLDRIPEFLARANAAVEGLVPGARPVAFGHFGDGNIHYNVSQPRKEGMGADRDGFLARWQDVSEAVFDIVDALGGSISAEHGIGVMKRDDLAARADPVKLAMMRRIKDALDPAGTMNPRVLFSEKGS